MMMNSPRISGASRFAGLSPTTKIDEESLLTNEEIRHIWDTFYSLRDKALFMTLAGTGLRIGEVLSMRVKYVIEKQGILRLRVEGNVGKYEVFIKNECVPWLKRWLLTFGSKEGKRPSGLTLINLQNLSQHEPSTGIYAMHANERKSLSVCIFISYAINVTPNYSGNWALIRQISCNITQRAVLSSNASMGSSLIRITSKPSMKLKAPCHRSTSSQNRLMNLQNTSFVLCASLRTVPSSDSMVGVDSLW
jgi:hypothetical protein